MKASTQNTIKYNSLFENGLMHIAKNEWSRTYKLGDVAYISANQEEKIDVIDTHAEALNSLDAGSTYQLLVINRRIEENVVEQIKYDEVGDGFDDFRREYKGLKDLEEQMNVIQEESDILIAKIDSVLEKYKSKEITKNAFEEKIDRLKSEKVIQSEERSQSPKKELSSDKEANL
nr:hypothetical protein [Streptococcus oralis]